MRILFLTLLTITLQSTSYTPEFLIDYTIKNVGYSRNYFISDPDRYLVKNFDFVESARILEYLYRYRGIKSFFYIVKNINDLSNNFPRKIAYGLATRLDYDFYASNYLVFVITIEQGQYFYYAGSGINYLNYNVIQSLFINNAQYFRDGYYGLGLLNIIKGFYS